MAAKLLKAHGSELEALVSDERRSVTYRSLARALQIPSNDAKLLLSAYISKHADAQAMYLVSGQRAAASEEERESSAHAVLVVAAEKLEETKSSLAVVSCVHVYSVQTAKGALSADALWQADHVGNLADHGMATGEANPLRDNRWSALTFEVTVSDTRTATFAMPEVHSGGGHKKSSQGKYGAARGNSSFSSSQGSQGKRSSKAKPKAKGCGAKKKDATKDWFAQKSTDADSADDDSDDDGDDSEDDAVPSRGGGGGGGDAAMKRRRMMADSSGSDSEDEPDGDDGVDDEAPIASEPSGGSQQTLSMTAASKGPARKMVTKTFVKGGMIVTEEVPADDDDDAGGGASSGSSQPDKPAAKAAAAKKPAAKAKAKARPAAKRPAEAEKKAAAKPAAAKPAAKQPKASKTRSISSFFGPKK